MSCKFGNDLCLHFNYVTIYHLGVVILQKTCFSLVKSFFIYEVLVCGLVSF